MNTTAYYIAVAANPANRNTIIAIGTTDAEAINNAVKAVGGDVTANDFVAEECTRRLFDYVEKNGTPDRWTTRNGIEDVEVEDESLLDDLIEHVFDGMEHNARYNSDSGLMTDWSDADHAISTYIEIEGMAGDPDFEGNVMFDYVALLNNDPYAKEIAEEELTGMMRRFDLKTLKEKIVEANDAEDAAEAVEKANAYAEKNGISISEIYTADDVPSFGADEPAEDLERLAKARAHSEALAA